MAENSIPARALPRIHIPGKKSYHRLWWRLLGWSYPTMDPSTMDPSEDPHSTVQLEGIAIDSELEAIISYLWAQGRTTADSCQGDSTLERLSSTRRLYQAIVSFTSPTDADWFAELIEESRTTPYQPGDLDCITISHNSDYGMGTYYHVSFPPELIANLNRLISSPQRDSE